MAVEDSLSSSDVQEQETTEFPRTPVAAVEAPPPEAEAAAPVEPEAAQTSDPQQPWTPVGQPSGAASEPAPRSLRPSWLHVVAVIGALIAGFLLYALLITGPLEARSQSHLLNQFRTELRTQKQGALLTAPADGSPVALIYVPQLSSPLEQVGVQGISSNDTKLGPGHYPSSVLPGQAGNSVFIGRGTTYGAPFAHIGDLQAGDEVITVSALGQFRYKVTQVSNNFKLGSVVPTLPTKGSRLTLISAASSFRPSKEWVVVASLEGKGFQARTLPSPPAGVQPGESTLTGAWGAILLWGELLFTAIAITWVLYRRRFAPAVTYLLTTPVLIALAYLFYGAIATLLPPAL